MPIISSPETLFGEVVIRPARPGEEDVVLDLLADAAAWLDGRGITQWPLRFPADSVRAQISRGEVLLVEEARQPVATLAVTDDEAEFWGPVTEPAYYVGRFAVARRAGGGGLGRRLIGWVAGKAADHGRQYVRLATVRHNPGLRGYYERAGFVHVVDPPHARWEMSLYQLAVTPAVEVSGREHHG
ncbi:GNAT family N-acetyltransferase [Saccharothrix obliqua]|uniref:GNAT family N-acetyltransferase n=1 Tax=Saccharothrix obliqua TaxID=2861747 RepID=UPI001C5EB356|nr:GNAT family N-acetyltransferase [Saccharothrix obliqua]MBW4718161.1 GNAT family N-acetyltransferase [Saccharothrix obliqua]